ncbi:unnamed protein product [Effrenium voratum]|uniref:EF-hand domain-containing protein n=1 Tax=Effrenium voratum TaxID=2562239 RepID=A0AA36I7W1_9DINO|nr:unnamed protein product [Effrenium voratum]
MCCRRREGESCCFGVGKDGERIPWIKSWGADLFFGGLILISAALLGLDIELGLRGVEEWRQELFWIQFGLLIIFVLELLLRVHTEGCRYLLIFANLLDALIISCSIAEYVVFFALGESVLLGALSVMRIFRLLRILRVVRLIRVCPKLYKICTSLVSAVRAVSWVFLLLFVFMYISALSCTVLLSNSKVPLVRDNFGSVFPSLYIHFVILTVEGFPELVAAIAQENGWLWYIYFVCYILFTNVMVMNTVTGVICQTVVSHGSVDAGAKAQCYKEFDKLKEVVLDCILLEGFRYDVHDEMSYEIFQVVMRNPGVRASFDAVDVCLDLEEEQLFNIIDENGDGKLSFDEFFMSLWRLRGSKDRLHSLLVQSDIVQTHKQLRDRVAQMSETLVACHAEECSQLRETLTERCQSLGQRLQEQLQQQKEQKKEEPQELARKQLLQLLQSAGAATATARATLTRLEEEISVKRSRVSELKVQVQEKMRMQEVEDEEDTSPSAASAQLEVEVEESGVEAQVPDECSPISGPGGPELAFPKPSDRGVTSVTSVAVRHGRPAVLTVRTGATLKGM